LNAGGFEWEDPTDAQFDQGVDNPFKNPEVMKNIKDGEGGDGEDTAIDPARLLGPRLQGSNLYLVGMMGSGKSSVGDKLARRK
jgi:shikimate kinase